MQKDFTEVNAITPGNLTKLNIIAPGDNYKVNETISFNNDETGGAGAFARISRVKGKPALSINLSQEESRCTILPKQN